MAPEDRRGDAQVRAEFIDGSIKGIAPRIFKIAQVVTMNTTSAWTNFFYREDPDVIVPKNIRGTTKGIPRLADFPRSSVKFEKIESTMEKYGHEDLIAWEDMISDEIPVLQRTVIKLAERIVKDVEDTIYAGLSGDAGIQTFNVTGGGATGTWDQASAAIIDNMLHARRLLAEKFYPVEGATMLVNDYGYQKMLKWTWDKGAQSPQIATQIAENGVKRDLAGINILVSHSVTASEALVVVPKRCATWKEMVPLSTTTMEDTYKSVKVRAVQLGVLNVTDPLAIVKLTGLFD